MTVNTITTIRPVGLQVCDQVTTATCCEMTDAAIVGTTRIRRRIHIMDNIWMGGTAAVTATGGAVIVVINIAVVNVMAAVG